MQISELWRYPVKSMAGERLESARLEELGVPGDRVLYVVDARGEIVSSRTKPGLLRHQATITAEGGVLVDGLPWTHSNVAEAVRAAAGPDARLVEARSGERFDILPLLVATDGAIADFGYDGRRLRPNLVIGGVAGLEERDWEGKQLEVGAAVIALAELRARCIMTTWDPDTGEQDVEVLRRIRSRFDGRLALNASVARPGEIALGDEVRVTEAAHPGKLSAPPPGRFG